ncbi:MAG: DUF692 domain-containing protein [Bdellovibrio sp.]
MDALSVAHKVGVNLLPPHFPFLEEKPNTEVAWFEAASENHMHAKGYSLEILELVRQNYPVALHGYSMNVGCSDGVCLDYLKNLRELIDRIDPFIVSDHFCWTGITDLKWHGLFPLPYTKESVKTLVTNIDFVQNFLRRPLALKNISSYISFHDSEMTEFEFLNEVIKKTGCNLVLDLSSLFVNSKNQHYDINKVIQKIPFNKVIEVQLAGPIDFGDFLFDGRSLEIPDMIWDLFKTVAPQIRHLPVLVSRTEDVPYFSEMENEVLKAVSILENSYEAQRFTETI